MGVVKDETQTYYMEEEEEEDEMTLSQFSLSRRRNTVKHLETREMPSSLKHKTKQVVSDNLGKSTSYKRKRFMIDALHDEVDAKSLVMEHAEEVQANLAAEFPSFLKSMLQSHVTKGFLLGLPSEFCNLHLPLHDTTVVLVDESGGKFKTRYLVEKKRLSGGWKAFSIAHKLLEGDVLVFHLVKPSKFKVYIVRANGSDEVDEEEDDEEEDEGQMTLSKTSLSGRRNTVDSSPLIKRRKPLETKKKLFRTKKMPYDLKLKTNQVISDNPGKPTSYQRKRFMIEDVNSKSLAMERAEEVQANLATDLPSFIKSMLRSHVTKGFWLGLPLEFCNLHLPMHDTTVILEDESGEEYKTKYLVEKKGLSGGWKAFSIAHKLLEGDALVFHLVKPSKFKMYIARANGLDEVGGALGLLNLYAHSKRMDFDHGEKDISPCKKAEEEVPLSLDVLQENINKNSTMVSKRMDFDHGEKDISPRKKAEEEVPLPLDILQENINKNSTMVLNPNLGPVTYQSENGLIVDSELSKHSKSFLHVHLLEDINCRLAAGIIAETTSSADAVGACKLTTSPNNFSIWDERLKGFEELGMNVGLLCARLDRPVSLAFESKEAVELKRYREARLERAHAAEELRILEEEKMLELKEAKERLDAEIESLKVNSEWCELMFQEEDNAPW